MKEKNVVKVIIKTNRLEEEKAVLRLIANINKQSKSHDRLVVTQRSFNSITKKDVDLAKKTDSVIVGLNTQWSNPKCIRFAYQNRVLTYLSSDVLYGVAADLNALTAT